LLEYVLFRALRWQLQKLWLCGPTRKRMDGKLPRAIMSSREISFERSGILAMR
ncbi:unnamed protein product, partial [Tuber aestivum]